MGLETHWRGQSDTNRARLVWVLVGALVLYFLARGVRQYRRAAKDEAEASRFAEALMDADKRGAVIDELTRELGSLDHGTAIYARRALMLAEY